jgi:hypothetical protein
VACRYWRVRDIDCCLEPYLVDCVAAKTGLQKWRVSCAALHGASPFKVEHTPAYLAPVAPGPAGLGYSCLRLCATKCEPAGSPPARCCAPVQSCQFIVLASTYCAPPCRIPSPAASAVLVAPLDAPPPRGAPSLQAASMLDCMTAGNAPATLQPGDTQTCAFRACTCFRWYGWPWPH